MPEAPNPIQFRRMISRLPEDHGLTGAPLPREWFRSQHEHWLGWLGDYDGPGYYGRKDHNRDARFIFNHVSNPDMVTWLAEAAGVDKVLVKRALDAMAGVTNSTSRAGIARRFLPWGLVWHHLQVSGTRPAKN